MWHPVLQWLDTAPHKSMRTPLLLTAKITNTEMTIQGTDRTNCILSDMISVTTEE